MECQELDFLRTRIERLERRMRMVVAGWVLSVAVVLLGVAVQEAVSQPETLRARRIEVVDAAGRTRIGLGTLPDGSAALSLADAAGRVRIGLGTFPDGRPRLSLMDAAGRERIGLGTLPDGSPGLSLADAAERTRIFLVTLPDGSPVLSLWDAAGRVLFRAP